MCFWRILFYSLFEQIYRHDLQVLLLRSKRYTCIMFLKSYNRADHYVIVQFTFAFCKRRGGFLLYNSIHAGNCQKRQMRQLIFSHVYLWSTIRSTRNDPHLCTDETESLQSHRMCHCEWNLQVGEFPTSFQLWEGHLNVHLFQKRLKSYRVISIIWTLHPIYPLKKHHHVLSNIYCMYVALIS